MLQLIAYFIMIPMVYIAFAVLIIGILYKFFIVIKSAKFKGTLGLFPKTAPAPLAVAKDAFLFPSAFRKDKTLWFFTMIFHIFLLLLVIGHVELVWDLQILQIIPHKIFLGGGVVGVILLISTLYFLFRRFRSPYREISVPEDYILLLILFLSMIFGFILHMADKFGVGALHVPVEEYRNYFASMMAFKPVLPIMVSQSAHYAVLVLHVLFANIFIMLFPFSKMMHALFSFFSLSLARK